MEERLPPAVPPIVIVATQLLKLETEKNAILLMELPVMPLVLQSPLPATTTASVTHLGRPTPTAPETALATTMVSVTQGRQMLTALTTVRFGTVLMALPVLLQPALALVGRPATPPNQLVLDKHPQTALRLSTGVPLLQPVLQEPPVRAARLVIPPIQRVLPTLLPTALPLSTGAPQPPPAHPVPPVRVARLVTHPIQRV